jgi:hypothetical protein
MKKVDVITLVLFQILIADLVVVQIFYLQNFVGGVAIICGCGAAAAWVTLKLRQYY